MSNAKNTTINLKVLIIIKENCREWHTKKGTESERSQYFIVDQSNNIYLTESD